MSDSFDKLYLELKSGRISAQHFLQEVRHLDDIVDPLLAALRSEVANQNWKGLSVLIWATLDSPDKRFTPVLCELLDRRVDNLLEATVDALDEIEDEDSVSCLIRALNYYVPGDGGLNFNKKIISALSRIGSVEAIEGIKLAFKSDEPEIRERAGYELAKFQ